MSSCPGDAAFGPRVDTTCRAFDFTLTFEDALLSCLPAALFLLFIPLQLYRLWKQARLVQRSALLAAKLGSLGALLICQLVFLIQRQLHSSALRDTLSLPADILELLAIVFAGILSYIHHCRSIRPSTLLVLFLSARSLLGIARVRTLWLVADPSGAAVPFTVGFAITLLCTILESTGKASSLVAVEKPPATPEPFSGLWKLASFAWLAGTFRRGYTKVLSVDDLPELDPQLDSGVVGERLERAWARADKTSKHALLRTCLHAYSTPLLSAIIPRLLVTGFTFCQPFLINATVSWVGTPEPEAPGDSGKALIGAFALVYVGLAVCTALFGYQNFRFAIRLRAGLIGLVHRQTVRVRAVDLGGTTAIALMGTDVERIVGGFRSLHELWASLVEVAVAIYLLERQVGVACLVPGVIVVVFISATFKLSAYTNKYQRLWIEKVEDRLRLTSYTLENIKAVKMLGLSDKIFGIVQRLREAEIATSAVFRKLLIGTITLSNSPADLAPMATFAVYVIIALVRNDNSILAAQAFTSLSLINLVTTPVLTFIQAVPDVIQCLGCFDRIQEYCSVSTAQGNEPDEAHGEDKKSIALVEMPSEPTKKGELVTFSNYTAAWKRGAAPVLRDISLTINHGITMLIGPVGSGKSTLLESILGETLVTSGQLEAGPSFSMSSVAYCSQTPWLQSQTIKENIIAASPVDETWYKTVIAACGLTSDLARLPAGDATAVGSGGMALSGGQKQRIALSRALYSRARVVLLDDVFSGIDAAGTERIARNLFGEQGLFRKIGSSVVLATHSGYLLRYADDILVLRDGQVAGQGTLEALTGSDYVQGLQITLPTSSSISSSSEDASETDPEADIDSQKDETNPSENESDELLEHALADPARRNGDWSVYAYYISSGGRTTVAATLVLIMGWTFCREFPTIWLDWWTEANARSPNSQAGMYLGVYVMFGLVGTVLMVVACWLFCVTIVSQSALSLHKNLVDSTARAPLHFFQRVEIGSITNRFSQDMDLIDMTLPIEALNVLAALSTSILKLLILASFARYLAAAIPFLMLAVYVTQALYLRTSRQMRLLDIEAKAPLYTHFLELVAGGSTVRAFGWHASFHSTLLSLLNSSQRPVYFLYCIQQCLGFVLDVLVTILAVVLVTTVVVLREKFDAGDVGVALLMVMTFNSQLMHLVKCWTMMETSIGAVKRVKDFVGTTEAEDDALPQVKPDLPDVWPAEGAISFEGVVAGHSPTSPPVLKNLTLSIPPGCKLAIVGSSGSGKTTLLLSLLRIVEPQSDSGRIVIDGVDLSSYPREEVRKRLNVITQDPFLVSGSVRFNVDPWGQVADGDIVKALERVGLWDFILQQDTKGDGLDAQINAAMFSVGQRQLLCLARAMVRPGRVLILDEATSSVDHSTESTMQSILETEFASHTILSVLHRLRYIHRYDKVAVLDAGNLVEFDSPQVLLEREGSRFGQLWRSGEYASDE
ncbi:ABC transporter, integral membrane type 1 [Aspergillus mulundensis]|uniref:ABC transporter, integral membrane type 1 n=1 Tax=Aspergillus mulundensis TaxID=1810919 RepID=A0A3D8T3B3_9EURO|nr:ABC transporter, integral membrane type 1 [Aspergillus mulundensis]RDW93046.1 ABC transporter, integral membrane type 1 [Aspergillus mulundensis]